MVNERLRSIILGVVDNQINNNELECTRQTFRRLIDSGYSEIEAKEMIGGVLAGEIFYILKDKRVFNEQEYAEKLNNLGRQYKVGLNGSCPCGSGKKYKKCCGG